MKQIVVTGALGLIGSQLVKKLKLNDNYHIVPVDIRYSSTDDIKNIDITNFRDIKHLVASSDGVIHLAAVSRVVWGQSRPELCHKINVRGTENIIMACLSSAKKPWLINASSREVYGQQQQLPVFEENACFNPLNYYAKSKCIAETLVEEAKANGLQIANVRFSGVYGGLIDHYNRVIPAFCTNALTNKDINIEGSECLFDFTYIVDAVNGIIKIVDVFNNIKESLPPIHFTTNQPASLVEIAEYILELTNSSSQILMKPPRSYDVTKFYGDFSRARTLLNWRPYYSLTTGLEKFISDLLAAKSTIVPNIVRSFDENLESYTWLPATL